MNPFTWWVPVRRPAAVSQQTVCFHLYGWQALSQHSVLGRDVAQAEDARSFALKIIPDPQLPGQLGRSGDSQGLIRQDNGMLEAFLTNNCNESGGNS
ncbi:hypothetical protein GCM10023187_17350 [Nibrella viscosa]|uniref:Uncharacterized protein n=1 Tax=Nibrella viscosa TaxID=1084524 RepID=A0ABP8K8M8_9BACT